MRIDSVATEGVLHDLQEKASGVFLWVVLACRSTLNGFAAYDIPADLQRRVDELLSELEALFSHILSKIQTLYQIQAAKLLKVCYHSYLL